MQKVNDALNNLVEELICMNSEYFGVISELVDPNDNVVKQHSVQIGKFTLMIRDE